MNALASARSEPAPHAQSWYAATAEAGAPRAPLATHDEADVAVVGGGFAGLHLARLQAARGRRVVLLERQRVGWGASGRNGGFVSPGYALGGADLIARVGPGQARAFYAWSRDGVALVARTAATYDATGAPPVRMGRGKLVCARFDQGEGFAARVRALAQTLGAGFEPWSTAQVRAVLDTPRYHQAVHDADALQIHPLRYAQALAGEVERCGGRIHEGTAALALEQRGAAWRVDSAQGSVTAPVVVLAGNADLGALHGRLARSVLPVATYVAVTERLGARLAAAVRFAGAVSDTRRAGDYWRVVDGDRLLWGGRITTRIGEPPGLRALLAADLRDVFAQLGDVRIEWAWPGTMGYAAHKMPYLGELEPGLWMSSAWGGHGVAQTAAGALLLDAAISEGDARWRAFAAAFPLRWAGGPLGRAATQLAYWRLQAQDRRDEARDPARAALTRT